MEETQEIKPFKSRWPIWIKTVSILVIGTFLFSDVARAADSFQLQRDRDKKDAGFLPRYLKNQQDKHEEFIQQQNDGDRLANSLDDELTAQIRQLNKKKQYEDEQRRSGFGGGGDLMMATGTDIGTDGQASTINVYFYGGAGELERIESFDAVGSAYAQSYLGGAEFTKGEDGEEGFFAGFEEVNIGDLGEDRRVSITYFDGAGKDRSTSHVISGFVDGKATQVSVYGYQDGLLRTVKDYSTEGLR